MSSPWGYNSADYYSSAVWEPQRNWQYEMIIKGLDPSSLDSSENFKGLGQSAALSAVASEQVASVVKLSVQDVSLPDFSINTATIPKALNRKKHIATGYSFGTMSISLLDDCNQDIDKLMFAWCQACVDPKTGKHGLTSKYKKKGCLAKFSPDGVGARFWIFEGLFPLRYNQSSYSRSGNNVVTISMMLNVDIAYPAIVTDLAEHGFIASMFL